MDSVCTRSICNIVVDAHRKRIWFLKHHADALAQCIDIHSFVYIFAIECYLTCDLTALDQIIHSIQAF